MSTVSEHHLLSVRLWNGIVLARCGVLRWKLHVVGVSCMLMTSHVCGVGLYWFVRLPRLYLRVNWSEAGSQRRFVFTCQCIADFHIWKELKQSLRLKLKEHKCWHQLMATWKNANADIDGWRLEKHVDSMLTSTQSGWRLEGHECSCHQRNVE